MFQAIQIGVKDISNWRVHSVHVESVQKCLLTWEEYS